MTKGILILGLPTRTWVWLSTCTLLGEAQGSIQTRSQLEYSGPWSHKVTGEDGVEAKRLVDSSRWYPGKVTAKYSQ